MTERQLTLVEDRRPDAIACTPSYALTIASAFAQRGLSPDDLSLRFAVVGAEPWSERMRAEIDAGLGVRTTNIYGLSEIIGPGVSCECIEERSGSHVNEDHFLPEIVDPESGEPLPEGDDGVLVLTTLTKEALPLVRYWTGDICSLRSGPCSCGRTFVRMGPIVGRTDDMLIVRGVNVYPSQVGAVLGRIPELSPHFGLVVRRDGTLDSVEVLVEPDLHHACDAVSVVARTAALIRETIGCSMTVKLVRPGEAPRSDGGKIRRVTDLR
jgi:phenylacetate-CoA ligase